MWKWIRTYGHCKILTDEKMNSCIATEVLDRNVGMHGINQVVLGWLCSITWFTLSMAMGLMAPFSVMIPLWSIYPHLQILWELKGVSFFPWSIQGRSRVIFSFLKFQTIPSTWFTPPPIIRLCLSMHVKSFMFGMLTFSCCYAVKYAGFSEEMAKWWMAIKGLLTPTRSLLCSPKPIP